jgi:hypothetical protein
LRVPSTLARALHDGKAGQHGTLGVVFMGEGRAKERKGAVAHEPGYSATIPIDRLIEILEGLVHDVCPDLGIEVLRQRRRSGDVAK